jgi:uncharacterized membrane protein
MRLFFVGLIVILAGFILILASVLLSVPLAPSSSNFAGVVFIGPIPIFFGSGSPGFFGPAFWLMLGIALILLIFYIVNIIIIFRKRSER